MLTFSRVMLLCTLVTSTIVGMPLAFSLFNRCLTAVHSEQSMAMRSTVGEATASECTKSSSSQHTYVQQLLPSLLETKPAEKLCTLLSRKHQERSCSSPIASPLWSTRSPLYKEHVSLLKQQSTTARMLQIWK